MTTKPSLDPRQLERTSGRQRMTIDYPVEIVRQSDSERGLPDGEAQRGNSLLHHFVNGVCVSCSEALRGKHSVEGEPREPHSGKWIHGAGSVESAGKHAAKAVEDSSSHDAGNHGMPASVVDIPVKVTGGAVGVSSGPDIEGKATLSAHGRSVLIGRRDREELRKTVVDAQYGDGAHAADDGVYRVTRLTESAHSEILVSLRPVEEAGYITESGKHVGSLDDVPDDEEGYHAEYDMVIGEGDDTDFNDEPKTRVSLKDLEGRGGILDTLGTAAAARRVDTGNGPTDVFVPRPGAIGLRTAGSSGKPTEVVLNARSFRRISAAITEVVYGPGEGLTDEESARNRDVTKVVETVDGPVEVRFHGKQQKFKFSDDSSLTITPQHNPGWAVTASGEGITRFMRAFDNNGGASGISPN